MIELTNTIAQVIPVGESLTFDTVLLHTGCGECHRAGSGSVKMRANGIYEVYFAGNITNASAASIVAIAMSLGGEKLTETTMTSVPSAAGNFNNVSVQKYIKNCCEDYDRVTITNVGPSTITIGAYPIFSVKRVS